MKIGRAGRVYLVVHPADISPSDEEWKALVSDLAAQAGEISGVLIYADGTAGPNSVQRKQITDMWRRIGRVPPMALISTSPITRAMATAINYFLSRPIRAFAPNAFDKAFEYIGVPLEERQAIRELIAPAIASMQGKRLAV